VLAITLSIIPTAFASSSIYMPVERLSAISPLIVEGTVSRIASGFDSTTGALSTYVTVEVSFVHRGPAGLDQVVVREPGGRFGDLVHAVDAVPVFTPGEKVLLFLEPARDQSLRVAGMFFGKLELRQAVFGRSEIARRDLSGQGLIGGNPVPDIEEFAAAEIDSIVASVPLERATGDWLPVPPELDRLSWDDVREAPAAGATPYFTTISSSYRARWNEADTATPVVINVQPAGNPVNDASAATNAIRRALTAWTNVPESRIVLTPGNENYSYVSGNAQSPAVAMPPVNIVLFDDPYDEITDPTGCSGTLAIGGYWRSGLNPKVVNGVTFYPTLRQYVIFNDAFQCFLGNADNLAEVATHELGHGLGFGHSTVPDAIMRSYAYGNGRGPRLGDDDRDGAHCLYPHTFALTAPNGGETWTASSTYDVTWSSSPEAGPDPGTVDVEYSTDAGVSWIALSTAQTNDGSYLWAVQTPPGTQFAVRVVRRNRVVPTAAPFPSACSAGTSASVFAVVAAPAVTAGTAPDGTGGPPVRLGKVAGGSLTVTWGSSCSGTAADYAIYEGTLSALRAGSWDHLPKTCSAGSDLTQPIVPGAASTYYLIAPLAALKEGSLGTTSAAVQRPASTSACAPRETASCF
jgi:hypothetical protein